MSDIRLPQRPMLELRPPVDGLDQVRDEASRRRRRRTGLTAAGLTAAAGVAVVVALSGAAGGVDVLKPAPPAGQGFVQPTPTPSATEPVAVGPAKARKADAGHSLSGRTGGHAGRAPSGGHGVDMLPDPTASTPPSSGQASQVQEPTLSRWQSTYTDSPARQCSGSTYGDGSGTLENSVGWCLDVTATPISDGVRLHVRLCRDSTGGGTLTFAGSREVDLAVQQGTRTVWDWAALHPGGAGAHQLSEPANGCMNWSLVWPGVTTGGQSAGHGTFTFVGTSTANEMKGKPNESVDFSY